MKNLKKILAGTTIVFTVVTALFLLLAIWELQIGKYGQHMQFVATFITLAALSFVSYVVVALYGKKN